MIYVSHKRIPDRRERKCGIDKYLYTGLTGKFIWDGYTHRPDGHFQSGWVYIQTLKDAKKEYIRRLRRLA